jgi:hypothetical protein
VYVKKEFDLSIPDIGSQQASMRLRVAFLHWAACLAIFIILIVLANVFDPLALLALLFYPVAGVYLNRSVLRRLVEWHPMYNTLYNVTSAKIKFFLFWPISFFFLFVRLGINKVL